MAEGLRQEALERRCFEKWENKRVLGSGAFGVVQEVLTDIGLKCAAKIIRLPVQTDSSMEQLSNDTQKLVDAERNLCQLDHPNIVKFLHMLERDAEIVVFMELLKGVPLEAKIDHNSLIDAEIARFAIQICEALRYLHSLKEPVIDRDINCSNIMVLNGGLRIKLIDFGLSIKLNESATRHKGSDLKGTINFMAPELLDNDDPVYSRESDIWAFGCTVYQMATGKRPHSECRNPYVVLKLIVENGAPSLTLRRNCSDELRSFYDCCVACDRKKRKSATELLEHEFLIATRDLDAYRDDQHGDFAYKVTSPQGFCMIINMENYGPNLNLAPRQGSHLDVERLQNLFNKLDFIVKKFQNLRRGEIMSAFYNISNSEELVNHGCFVCFIMAHGCSGGFLCSDGELIEYNHIYEMFSNKECINLKGKPKIFFVQACRGGRRFEDYDGIQYDGLGADTDGSYIPRHADYLICHSVQEGYSSTRYPNMGSPFVQTLCNVIEAHYQTRDIQAILTIVFRDLRSSPLETEGAYASYSQPQMVSTLRTYCFLNPMMTDAEAKRIDPVRFT